MDTFGIVLVFSVLVGLVDVCFSACDWRFEGKYVFVIVPGDANRHTVPIHCDFYDQFGQRCILEGHRF